MTMWLTMEQAAEVVGVASKTLSNYRKGLGLPAGCRPLKASVLPSGRVVRIKREWLDEFMEQFATKESLVDTLAEKLMGRGR